MRGSVMWRGVNILHNTGGSAALVASGSVCVSLRHTAIRVEPRHQPNTRRRRIMSASQATPSIQICRIMRPDDANIVGNVHGGTILKMIEEAGCIIGTRHCNTQTRDRCVAALARVERTDFLHPMFIGDVAHVSAEITYTSKHSVEVQVTVLSENIVTGGKKVTNKATLWYVPLSLQNVDKIIEVPPIQYSSAEQEESSKKRYEAQKLERLETIERNGDVITPVSLPEPYTVGFSQSSLIHLIGPSDCTLHGFVHGGVTMKLMDEVAGIVAARHCKTNIVTASVDAINFHRKIKKGCVITVSGRMTFTSNKSMEIEVFVDADSLVEAEKGKYRSVTAFFTYISLDKDNKPLAVPPLKLDGEEEQERFEEGKARYLQNKAKRLADQERPQ
ncbi:cytosolic acyl coenzyme A thioester hydrolase isoform X2 [Triplophysa rosa]|uniref:cytosolic acyl coenzyme A thioester hydrolase isoform X2 n=1 Tax=Triplophysa rosa TaxID=992332 RepID=UPI002545C7FE|nr:cytosolic acyl coenzyme A thioester hydrolase isoform X2 [Triplophysa rosa]